MQEELNDNELLLMWKVGNEAAFRTLYLRHFIPLVKFAHFKMGDFVLSEEIVQDTFLSLYLHKEAVHHSPLFYLHTVLKHKIIDHYRKRMHPLNVINGEPHEGLLFNNHILDEINYQDLSLKIHEGLMSLPNQCQRVFLLSREQQLSNREIADKLGISIKTVEQHITKALKLLRQNLGISLVLSILLEGIKKM
ncbi:MAG: hypothetical protein DI598_17780 [Pseudopedobacter saltans]|uniref:RNA polymerase, sigma-24 subunit, ECF subfamily n=1 Tax=Pseudopedobacter saltans TaxID=151895 RepID=A0A2W5ECU6_9SPHI|nr:MAG: hypothetical protein DI598_17780 [Pseudopedobacter saltans]